MSQEGDLEMNNVGRTATEFSDVLPRSLGEGMRGPPDPRTLSMPAGHPRFAEVMSRRPQLGIYRRFGYLNAQNLLYMQAELVSLENALKDLQSRDARATDEQLSNRARDWKELSNPNFLTPEGAENQGNKDSHLLGASCCGHKRCEEWCCGEVKPHEHCEQWKLAMKIREKLQRYNDALIQQMALVSAGVPDSYDLEWIRRFLASEMLGMKDALLGDDKFLWGRYGGWDETEPVDDLIAVAPLPKRDPFNEWIFKKLAKRILDPASWWRSIFNNRSLEGKILLKWTAAAAGSVTAAVPIVSTMALYLTPNNSMRLVLLVVFNILAAFFLYCITDAQPMQIFTICAAWNAVNIVFVGSNDTGGT